MNAAVETVVETAAPVAATRPFFWSLRRELWEHRSLFIAPLSVAAVIVVSFLSDALQSQFGMRLLTTQDSDQQRVTISILYAIVAFILMATTTIVACIYCLDALHGERRDRSVLFWKSLPVSDTTAVLAKLAIATIVAPLIGLAIIVATELLLVVLGTGVLLAGGLSPVPLWSNLQLFQLTVGLLYTFAVLSLWYAPIYGWLLFVSAWAKRSTFLWATLPPFAVGMFGEIAFNTNYFAGMIEHRLQGVFYIAFSHKDNEQISVKGKGIEARIDMPDHVFELFDPLRFLADPYLWVGLAVAAGLIAATVWMRRYREPI